MKKKSFCFRCKRVFEEGEDYHILVLPSGDRVPVCRNDKECYRKDKEHGKT